MIIVGVMPVYEEADWIEWAVEGIIDFVDELVIAEGYQGPAWHFGTCRSKDGTIDIIKKLAKKHDKITLTKCQPCAHVLRGKAATHNHVLKMSRLINKADWYMICDADEFYSDRQKETVRKALENTTNDAFSLNARYFFYNFEYFIYMYRLVRIFRVTDGMYFKPGQFPYYADGRPYYDDTNPSELILEDDPMFHYSFVKKPSSEIKRRIMEYCAAQRYKFVFDWIEQVYLKWSRENAEEIYELNARLFNGQGGIFFDGHHDAQRLRVYKGEHPRIMNNHPFRHIKDIREIEELPSKVRQTIGIQHHVAHYLVRFFQKVNSVLRTIRN